MRTRAPLCTAIATLALLATAGPAAADGFSLTLSAPETPVVGKPMLLEANGSIPLDHIPYSYWFSLSAIPTAVTTTCPSDHFEAKQIANATGGAILVFTQREAVDGTGNFSIPVGITPSAPGPILLCGYTDDGFTNTLAIAPLLLEIEPAPGSTPTPTPTSAPTPSTGRRATIPEETRAGIRSCKALLSRPQSCIRKIVRQANAACRREPKRRRAACLRGVRRVARSAS